MERLSILNFSDSDKSEDELEVPSYVPNSVESSLDDNNLDNVENNLGVEVERLYSPNSTHTSFNEIDETFHFISKKTL